MSDAKGNRTSELRALRVNRELLEKALQQRCVSYYANAEANLLIRTVSSLGESKRDVLLVNRRLREEIERRQRLEASLRRTTAAIESTPLMVAITSDGRIEYANEAFRERLGGPASDEDSVPLPEELLRCLDAESPCRGEIEIADAAGECMWGRTLVCALDESRRAVFVEDITEEREAAERMRHLERLEALGHLTSGIAHDFNNLLCSILVNAELVQLVLGDDHPATPHVQAILEAGTSGSTLTSQLVGFTRSMPTRLPTSVRESLERVMTLVERTLGATHQLGLRLVGSGLVACCDRGQLEAAVLNLLINARDASPEGSEIEISAERVCLDQPREYVGGRMEVGEYVRVAVSDQGTGIRPDALEKIWQPFFTTKAGRGSTNSGLGLPMVLRFAQSSGGAISLQTEPGVGTTFYLFLPTAEPRPTEESEASATGSVLLVDDEPVIRDATQSLLRQLGFHCTACADGRQALNALASAVHFDLAIVDLELGGGRHGTSVGRQLRSVVPGLPLVYISGRGGLPKDLEETDAKGTRFLAKPFRAASLLETIETLLNEVSEDDDRAEPGV